MNEVSNASLWEQLLPDFLGTLIGAALAIPVGLFLAHTAQGLAARHSGETEAQRLEAALSILRDIITVNVAGLRDMVTTLDDPQKFNLLPGITTAAWVALRTDVLVGRADRKLRLDPRNVLHGSGEA